MDENRTLVERKLSGTFTTISVVIPWEWFQHTVDHLYDELQALGLKITKSEIMEHPMVIDDFEDTILQARGDYDFSWMSDYEPRVEDLFSVEIKAHQTAETKRLEELNKNTVAVIDPNISTITVPAKQLETATAILRAAKII